LSNPNSTIRFPGHFYAVATRVSLAEECRYGNVRFEELFFQLRQVAIQLNERRISLSIAHDRDEGMRDRRMKTLGQGLWFAVVFLHLRFSRCCRDIPLRTKS